MTSPSTDPSTEPGAEPSFPACVPVLTDGHVLLRAHRESDAERIVEQSQDPESIAWTTIPAPYGPDDARQFLELIAGDWERPDGNRSWAITAASDPDTLLGTIDIRPSGSGLASIGFGLHPQGRGRGLMTAAVRLATQWWFDRGGVRMHWEANRGNFPSWRVAHSCGFIFHGTVPQSLLQRGEVMDAWTGSIGRDGDLTKPVTPWHEPAVLEGAGIRLRPWRESDADALEPPDTPAHFAPGIPPTAETFAEWLLVRRERAAFNQATHWCIADLSTDRALGQVLLIDRGQQPGSAELGYQLFPSARGRGAATRAGRLVLAHAFSPAEQGGRGLRRVMALSVADNEASAAVLERLGFTQWGREPQFCAREDGTYDDARHWVLHRSHSDAKEATSKEIPATSR